MKKPQMTDEVIESIEAVTPRWLTAVLRAKGVLDRGEVARIAPSQPERVFASLIWRLKVDYSQGSPPHAPRALFLKRSSPDLAPGEFNPQGLKKEIVFYRTVAAAMDDPPLVRCYHAAHSARTGACHLLLEDLSETHYGCHEPSNDTLCLQAVAALANFHAQWWDHPRLRDDLGGFPTPQQRKEGWAALQRSTSEFMAHLGDRLLSRHRAVYENVLPALPRLSTRHTQGRNLTLVHGDAHLGNFLYPRDPIAGRACMIDWQFWHPTVPGTDLAFMIATEWEPTVRRRLEQPLLRHYYAALERHGVRGYSWEDCWYDYRLGVILMSIFIPVWRWSGFHWEPDITTLERSMAAFEELRCSELLSGR